MPNLQEATKAEGVRKILITAGAGFIGSHLTDELLNRGYDIRILDNLSTQVHVLVDGVSSGFSERLRVEDFTVPSNVSPILSKRVAPERTGEVERPRPGVSHKRRPNKLVHLE